MRFKPLLLFVTFFFLKAALYAQPLTIQWQKCFGGTLGDAGYSIKRTNDGGYLVGGLATSNDGDVSGNHHVGLYDYWVLKIDSSGNLQWQKCYGGSDVDRIYSLQLVDQGFIVAGQTGSYDGDVIGMHGADAWIVKCDTSGIIQWQKCLGGSNEDGAYDLIKTFDQGYAVFGYARSLDFDVVGRHYNPDYEEASDAWLVKLDTAGNIQWSKCYGGDVIEVGYSLVQTQDSGYILLSEAESSNGDVQGHHGFNEDYWVVKVDAIGGIEWQKCLGGSESDIPQSIIQTFDNGYLITGYSFSNDFDVASHHGASNSYDAWVVKLDSGGNLQWEKSLGGSTDDYGDRIIQLADSGYLAVNVACSIDGDLLGNPPSSCDIWIVKMDQTGNIQWQQCLGGSCDEEAFDIELTPDGGAILTGATCSNDGDVSGNHGNFDVWVVKLAALPDAVSSYSNPVTDFFCHLNNVSHLSSVNFYSDKTETVQFNLLDMTGRNIIAENFCSHTGSNKTEVRIPALSHGIYIARLITSNGVVSKKVRVE